ncbi:MAG: tRNA 2-thiouridine(34) synthase MnmA [Phycisphaerales bacterium]
MPDAPPEPRSKVLLAMSGGVDSSVAAALLQDAGPEVVGCFMRLGDPEEPEGLVADETAPSAACDEGGCATGGRRRKQGCCSVNDAADARIVAARLGVPLYVMNFRRDFGRVIDYFVGEYNAGRTPNPCVRCNDWLKFGRLHEHAEALGCTHVASGHYARIRRDADGHATLRRGLDAAKDQTYALFGIRRDRIGRTLFPIGELHKPEVRRIAERRGLPVFDKPDSQEICFVPDHDYAGLVARRSPESVAPGRILDDAGRVLGEHPGHQHFTIGQRRRLGVASSIPLYVLAKDPRSNEIVVGPKERLRCGGALAADVNWLAGDPPAEWRRCTAQWRLHGEAASAQVRVIDREGSPAIEVLFDEPQEMLAPGQAIVCYDEDVVLGGAWIDEAILD